MEPAEILNLINWALQNGPAWVAPAQAWNLQSWSESAASILISSLWQGAVVACGLALCLRLAPKMPSRLRYGVWASGFLALVCLPFLPSLIERLSSSPIAASSANSLNLAAGSAAHPLFALDARWSLGLAALWLAASLLRASGLAAHAVRMRRLWRSADPVPGAGFDALLQKAVGAPSFRRSLAKGWHAIPMLLGRIRIAQSLRAPVELCVTNDLDRPCVIGFFRPRILIPAWLLNRLTPAELEQVVLHESEHLRRMDDWSNLLQKLCLVVFPLNPALWWIERRLCAERELACDDGVVRRTRAPRAYAACLAGLAEKGLHRRQAALSLGAWQHRPELAARVHRLLRRPTVLSPVASWTSVALVGCGLVSGVVALARSPQLVAFVAPAKQTSLNADADFAQATELAGPAVQPYRMVNTLAILPARRAALLPHLNAARLGTSSISAADPARQTGNSVDTGHSLASLIPTAVAAQLRAQRASQLDAASNKQASAAQISAAQSESTQTGWLVLTTYEEIQTIGPGQQVQGDSVAGETSTHAAEPSPKTSTSISVTRLVLHFVQPTTHLQPDSSAASPSKAPAACNAQPTSNPVQPIAIPYRDGWLVIQL